MDENVAASIKKTSQYLFSAIAVIAVAGCATLSRTDFPVEADAQAELVDSGVIATRIL